MVRHVTGAQRELAGHQKLPFIRRLWDAFHFDVTDEKRWFGDEFQSDAAVLERGIHGDVGILAGLIQALDGIAQIGTAQWLPHVKRKHSQELIGRQRLPLGIEFHAGYRLALVGSGRHRG